MTFIGIILLGSVTLLAISLQRTYGSIPLKELKRRARSGDKVAEALHRAASYGSSLRALLWVIIAVLAGWFFVAVTKETVTWFAILSGAVLLWFGFVWLPAQEATRAGVWLASQVAPALEKVLIYLDPLLQRMVRFVRKHRTVSVHTGLYDTYDLLELFRQQKVQSDSRVDQQTLEIVEHALLFGDKIVSDILTPRRVVKAVASSEVVGPVLMTDLHKSGHSRFPVYEDKQDNIIGILYLRDLVRAKSGGTVQKVMSGQVCYVHEDQPLTEALDAILKTHQQLFVVVNSFEEYVGIVTMEDVMEAIVGKQIIDEFDQYDDLRAVAAKMAQTDHKKHLAAHPPEEIPPSTSRDS